MFGAAVVVGVGRLVADGLQEHGEEQAACNSQHRTVPGR